MGCRAACNTTVEEEVGGRVTIDGAKACPTDAERANVIAVVVNCMVIDIDIDIYIYFSVWYYCDPLSFKQGELIMPLLCLVFLVEINGLLTHLFYR